MNDPRSARQMRDAFLQTALRAIDCMDADELEQIEIRIAIRQEILRAEAMHEQRDAEVVARDQ